MLYFLNESTKDFEDTETIGGFSMGTRVNTFDDIYESAHEHLLTKQTDVMTDINDLIKNDAKYEYYKNELLADIKTECENMKQDPDKEYGTHVLLYEQLNDMMDNCRGDLIKESTNVGQLLPIKAIDFPILVKQYLKIVSKDILQCEITKSPIIKKHFEQCWIIDKNDATGNKKWKYPQCFLEGEFQDIFNAGKGLVIKDTPVDLPIYNYDIVKNLTDSTNPDMDHFTFDLQIRKVVITTSEGDKEVSLKQPMRISLQDNQWHGGMIDINVEKSDGTFEHIEDCVTGLADPKGHTVALQSFNAKVKSVIFTGYLSNENNMRHVTFDYTREETEFKIEDGTRADASFTLEQLEDAKALMDIDLYKKTYNHMSDYLAQMEDMDQLQWLDLKFEEYKGIEDLNPLDWDGFITEDIFDCDSTSITTALPTEFIAEMLKFKIDRMIMDIADTSKIEDYTFVLYGNPRIISLLGPNVKWVSQSGGSSNGVKLDYSYGIMTSNDVKVQVVSTKKRNISYDEDNKLFKGIRIIPFPLSEEQFTFKHYKYTSHIRTDRNSAYRDPLLQGGSETYLMGVSRYTNKEITAIQSQLDIAGAEPYIHIRKKN